MELLAIVALVGIIIAVFTFRRRKDEVRVPKYPPYTPGGGSGHHQQFNVEQEP